MKSKESNNTTSDTNAGGDFSFVVGKVVGFRGLKGELKISPSTNSPDILLALESVRIGSGADSAEEATVKSVSVNNRSLLIQLDQYPDRTSSEVLKDKVLFTQPDQLLELEENQWWVNDLVGLKVVDSQANELGRVSDIYGNDGEFLEIELKVSGEKRLVPFVKAIVPRVDMESGVLEVNPPPGLLD